jgi:hypothetical protein
MYKCPHCGNDSFTFWQKQTIGPLRAIECRFCKGKVGVPWLLAMLCLSAMLPAVAVGYYYSHLIALDFLAKKPFAYGASGPLTGILVSRIGGVLIGYTISALLYHRYVPLIPR